MVLDIDGNRKITAVNAKGGLLEIQAGAVILAMGCRERTRPQVRILGTRPAGVMTAGAVQRYINVEGWKPGKRAVILGSGDIGLIMARRMTLEGISVEGVYEVMPNLGGLRRNKAQCLDDYQIPLHLSTTVVSVHGKRRLEGVTVAAVGADRKPVPGTERYIECDLLVFSVGLIPENEPSRKAGIEIDPVTKGPVVDDQMMTTIPGVFAAGRPFAAKRSVAEFENLLNQAGYTCGQYPQSFQSAVLGGMVSTRAIGTFSTKYGKMDDMVNSLEVVLPNGHIYQSHKWPKASTGPEMDQLFLGAEGVYGVVIKVEMKIYPVAEKRYFEAYTLGLYRSCMARDAQCAGPSVHQR